MTQILVLATPVLWIIWDVYTFLKNGNASTESATIWKYSVRLPGIALLVGILIGHLFFQLYLPTEFAKDDKGHPIWQVGSQTLSPGQILTVDKDGLLIPAK